MNIPERERPQGFKPNSSSRSGHRAQPRQGDGYSRLLKPSYLKRWRRSWRPRVWAAGAGALGIIAGAGVIAISRPAPSAAASIPAPQYVVPTTTQPFISAAPMPAPRIITYVPTYRAPQTTTRPS